jgi:hypothetical protein
VSAQTAGPDFEGVLGRHEYVLGIGRGGICACGFVPTVNPSTLATQQDYHRAHVAAELRAEVGRWLGSGPIQALADQWNETPDYTPSEYDQGRVDQRHDMTMQLLAALAECVGVEEVA